MRLFPYKLLFEMTLILLYTFLQEGSGYEAEPRSSFVEGARDVAVLEAMLESGNKGGALVHVKKL